MIDSTADKGWPTSGEEGRASSLLSPSDRDRILQAMIECCAELGYQETGIEAVLTRADVSRGRFDDLFSDKEDCALAAIEKVMSETLARVGGTDSVSDIDLRRGVMAGKAMLELLAARPSYPRLNLIEARQSGTQRMKERYESGLRMLTLVASRARESSRQSSATSVRAAVGGVEAVVRQELVAGRAEHLPKLLPSFVYGVLVPLIGQDGALRQSKLAARLLAEGAE